MKKSADSRAFGVARKRSRYAGASLAFRQFTGQMTVKDFTRGQNHRKKRCRKLWRARMLTNGKKKPHIVAGKFCRNEAKHPEFPIRRG